MRPRSERPAEKLFTFRSGGWVLVVAAVVGVFVLWRTLAILGQHREESFGDGKNVETYEFALEPCLVDREHLVAANMPRNGVPAMTDPSTMIVEDLVGHPSRKMRKFLVSKDRVVGVEISGEARAYPLRILNWHEVVNDTLGGVPIAVTYHPLCDSVVVFDRRMGEETLVLQVSGLLWNSSQLLYAKGEKTGGESLYSQLQARAVTGPDAAAGKRLTVLPCEVIGWGDWRERHPDGTVIEQDQLFKKKYPTSPYGSYFGTRNPRFPVDPDLYPPPGDRDGWDRVLVLEVDGEARLLRDYKGERPAAAPTRVFHALYWAWHATRPVSGVGPGRGF